MFADAHVHVGYFNCCKSGEVEYYSPRRVIGVLNRCGVDEFVVSSTSAQASPTVKDLIQEAEEIKRQAGARAHIFDWVTWRLFRQDQKLVSCVDGLYEGIKLHEQEGHWIEHHYGDLLKVLDIANERNIPIVWISHDLIDPRAISRNEMRKQFNDFMFTVMNEEPLDASLLDFDDSKGW